jgi:hypothetical protein
MSWSLFISAVRMSNVAAAADAARAAATSPIPDDQFDAALEAAQTVLDSGAVGDIDDLFNISLSGHANPDHKPADGMSNDMINVTVSQAIAAA